MCNRREGKEDDVCEALKCCYIFIFCFWVSARFKIFLFRVGARGNRLFEERRGQKTASGERQNVMNQSKRKRYSKLVVSMSFLLLLLLLLQLRSLFLSPFVFFFLSLYHPTVPSPT